MQYVPAPLKKDCNNIYFNLTITRNIGTGKLNNCIQVNYRNFYKIHNWIGYYLKAGSPAHLPLHLRCRDGLKKTTV
jgi:hypothetical protein